MKAEEFYALVGNMRSKQKQYFKTRDVNVLQESKNLEKQVDQELERFEESKFGNSLF